MTKCSLGLTKRQQKICSPPCYWKMCYIVLVTCHLKNPFHKLLISPQIREVNLRKSLFPLCSCAHLHYVILSLNLWKLVDSLCNETRRHVVPRKLFTSHCFHVQTRSWGFGKVVSVACACLCWIFFIVGFYCVGYNNGTKWESTGSLPIHDTFSDDMTTPPQKPMLTNQMRSSSLADTPLANKERQFSNQLANLRSASADSTPPPLPRKQSQIEPGSSGSGDSPYVTPQNVRMRNHSHKGLVSTIYSVDNSVVIKGVFCRKTVWMN